MKNITSRTSTLHKAATDRLRQQRLGAAAVEFAIVAPLLFLIVLGIIEFGRGMMVSDMLNHAARHGCRVGVISGRSNADILQAVNQSLEGARIGSATTEVRVNGGVSDAVAAYPGDTITVTVSVPYNEVSWIGASRFLGGTTLSKSIVMRRE